MASLTYLCDRCSTHADRLTVTDDMEIRSCLCGAWKRCRFVDPSDRIRQDLETAARLHPGNNLIESFTAQFKDRGTLTPKQLEALARLVK